MDFRDRCLKNDEKLRLIFKINASADEAPEPEVVSEISMEAEIVEEEEDEVITLNPNKLYESSDESENETQEEQRVLEPHQVQTSLVTSINNNQAPKAYPIKVGSDRKEIFHCRYCDIVFSDSLSCTGHEQFSHDKTKPYECVACSFKTDQHPTLIFHIKQTHQLDKPFLCTQCTKSFIRRSDLRKHTFVHSGESVVSSRPLLFISNEYFVLGIRLFSCEVCSKSFTRNTNLTKHKRTHSENFKAWKCTECQKAFYSKTDLVRHTETHTDRKPLNCRHCNLVFNRKDQLEAHQKKHFETIPSQHVEPPPVNPIQQQPIVFYNQPAPAPTPMNFYTENRYPVDPSTSNPLQLLQPKKEYPIMNQLLTGMGMLQPVKNFICGTCSKAFAKKKELDRHVISVHTAVKQFGCGSCPKTFSRKDKLLNHEKTHVLNAIFNCSLCPAVFIRKEMLDMHVKVHQLGNGETQISFMPGFRATSSESNGFAITSMAMNSMEVSQLESFPPMPDILKAPTANNFPINLSMSGRTFNEPMNLSSGNHRMEASEPNVNFEQSTKMSHDSDEDTSGLQIVDEPQAFKTSVPTKIFNNLEVTPAAPAFIPNYDNYGGQPMIPGHDETIKNVEEITFSMTSRLADLDKQLEPLRDLPMEILNND